MRCLKFKIPPFLREIRKMDEIITQNMAITDTGSTIFVDYNNNNKESQTTETDFCQNSAIIAENTDKTIESSPLSRDFEENEAKYAEFQAELFNGESKSAFSKDFPDIDIEKLRNREEFQSLLGILMKRPTLSQAYACFNTIVEFAESNAEKRVMQALANAKSGVGSLSSKENSEEVFFTKEQVLKMSKDEIKRNLTKIKSSQARW